PTGPWTLKVQAGGATFEKILRVETVKPNRFKIQLDFGREALSRSDEPLSGTLQVNWLHGPPAREVPVQVESELKAAPTAFPNFGGFRFDDPAREVKAEPRILFDSRTDARGSARFQARLLEADWPAPGKLAASFRVRAEEPGGGFSIQHFDLPYSPYPAYCGVRIPENDYGEPRLDIGRDNPLRFALVDEAGRPLSGKTLNVGVYRLEWSWWWEQPYENLSRYNSSTHFNAQSKAALQTNSRGLAEWTFRPDEWGRYLVRVCDPESGHCAGTFAYAGYPWYEEAAGRSAEAAMMVIAAGKEKYRVGETIELKVPAGQDCRVLITLEKGGRVLSHRWEAARAGENVFRLPATPEMAPNVYAHVTLLQAHTERDNDLPMRLYGVLPILVENPDTRLQPRLEMPEELQPRKPFEVRVAEEGGRRMAYTIAIVDEGLLDLTRFPTPDPHAAIYAKEALGVKTWDLYDEVLGAYGGQLERLLSIGGGQELERSADRRRARRFQPVVLCAGPFLLEAGRTRRHRFTMPNYVGSVRAMVVAANREGAYGHSEATVPVREALMVLGTLPRVLGPGETLRLPVSVFAMEPSVRKVTVRVEDEAGLLRFPEGSHREITFSEPGEALLSFPAETSERVGVARVRILAEGGGKRAVYEAEIQVRNPNPPVSDVFVLDVPAGQTRTLEFRIPGVPGTNEAVLELSTLPPLNLHQRLKWLLGYPHGCIEQTVSKAFPQLFVGKLSPLSKEQSAEVERNVAAALEKLRNFQQSSGAFSYWPGGEVDEWATSYAGHFLLEAQAQGYRLPPG
ncbi:MAG: alpha-2-macroglobulin, partial [Bacteroidetes bacterium]